MAEKDRNNNRIGMKKMALKITEQCGLVPVLKASESCEEYEEKTVQKEIEENG